jgi:LPS export ABC transporter protein LptC
MAITRFFYALFAISLVFMFYTKESEETVEKKELKPMVVFENSLMYTIDATSINYIVQATKVNIFNGYEELYNASITSKGNQDTTKPNNLRANHIVKKIDDVYLNGDVYLESFRGSVLKTEQLDYNLKTNIAKNKTKFEIIDSKASMEGDTLFFNIIDHQIVAKNTKFKIDMKENR